MVILFFLVLTDACACKICGHCDDYQMFDNFTLESFTWFCFVSINCWLICAKFAIPDKLFSFSNGKPKEVPHSLKLQEFS